MIMLCKTLKASQSWLLLGYYQCHCQNRSRCGPGLLAEGMFMSWSLYLQDRVVDSEAGSTSFVQISLTFKCLFFSETLLNA